MYLRKRLGEILVVIVLFSALFWVSTLQTEWKEDDDFLSIWEEKKESIYFWYNDASISDYVNSAAISFGEKNNVRVFPQLVSESEYLEAINRATLQEERIPDVFLVSNDLLEKAYLAGLALPIADVNHVMNTIHFPQTAIDAVTYKNKQVAYPLFYETSALLYNKTFLSEWALQQAKKEAEEAGRAPNEVAEQARRDEIMLTAVPKTIDDILRIADSFDPPETIEGIFKWDVSDIFYNYYFVGNYMEVGGDTGDDKSIVTINNPKAIACLKVYKELNQFFYIESDMVTYDSVMQDFLEGRIVFTIATTDAIAMLEEAEKEGDFVFEYGVAPLPSPGESLEGRPLSVTGCIAVNGYSSKQELAEQFAMYLATEYASQLYERSKRMAVYNFVNQDNEVFDIYHKEYERSISLPKMLETGNYWIQLEVLFSKVWNGEDVEMLVMELEQRIKSQINAKE